MAGKKDDGHMDLEAVKSKIVKEYGAGSLMALGDAPLQIPSIPTGSIGLDWAMGIGGLPCGRIVEVFGPPSAGKTTVVLHAVGNVQRAGGIAAFIDAEHALTRDLVRACGGNDETLLLGNPDFGEQALEIANMLVCSDGVDIVVVDSVAALAPKAEIEGELENEKGMALHARMMSGGLRKINASLGSHPRACVVFINQLREKPGFVMGNPEYRPGGKALPFYASMCLDVRVTERLKSGTVQYGNKLRVRVVKNKCAPPFREAEFQLWFGKGIHRIAELAELAGQAGIISKNGSHYTYNGTYMGNGVDAAAAWLYQHPVETQQINANLAAALRPAPPQALPPLPETVLEPALDSSPDGQLVASDA